MITRFTIHITLYGSENTIDGAGEFLVQAMLKEGFSDTITLDDEEYQLPEHTYIRDGIDLSANDIRAAAIRAGNSTGQEFGIVVTEVAGKRLFWNLNKI